MNYDQMLADLLQRKYEAPDLGPTAQINPYTPPTTGGGGQSGVDPKALGALANLLPREGAEETPPIGESNGAPVYNYPVAPDQGMYLPGGTPETAGSAGIQNEQPGSEAWVRKILQGVGM